MLISSGGARPAVGLLKKPLAAVSVPRRYSYSEPCRVVRPDLVTSATSAPEPRPVAASPFEVTVRNSSTESSVTRSTLVNACRVFWSR